MAFNLTGNLERTLNAKTGLTNERINPSNLERLDFTNVAQLPSNFLTDCGTEASADQFIDHITAESEQLSQATRAIDAANHYIDCQQKYQTALKSLREKVAKLEITIEEAFAQWQTLKHQLNLARKQAGLKHASDVENANIAYAKFDRGLREKLHTATDISRNGIHQGSHLEHQFVQN
ncbi:hypothetical protein SPB21_22515 [Leptothoe sp. ISB3NOV94-8A]